jgi:hypothetical protein
MFEQENALPRSQLHFAINNRHSLAGARQDHADMGWHVIAAFGVVREIFGIFWHQPVEEFFEITSRSRIGIFHNDHAATGVLNKHCRRPVSDAASIDLRLHFIRDFVQSLSVGANLNPVVTDTHWSTPRTVAVMSSPSTSLRTGSVETSLIKRDAAEFKHKRFLHFGRNDNMTE